MLLSAIDERADRPSTNEIWTTVQRSAALAQGLATTSLDDGTLQSVLHDLWLSGQILWTLRVSGSDCSAAEASSRYLSSWCAKGTVAAMIEIQSAMMYAFLCFKLPGTCLHERQIGFLRCIMVPAVPQIVLYQARCNRITRHDVRACALYLFSAHALLFDSLVASFVP